MPKSNVLIKVIVLYDTLVQKLMVTTRPPGTGFLYQARWDWLKKELADGDAAGQLMIIRYAHTDWRSNPAGLSTERRRHPQNAVNISGTDCGTSQPSESPHVGYLVTSSPQYGQSFSNRRHPQLSGGFWQVATSIAS